MSDSSSNTDRHEVLVEQVYRKHVAGVRARALQILRDERKAEDITQDVFVEYLKHRERGGDERQTAAFLFKMTTNLALNYLRNVKRRRELLQQNAQDTDYEPESDSRLLLEYVLAQVDEKNARVAIHYYIDEMEHQEIADLMSIKRRTVGRCLDRFHAEARKILARKQGAAS